jgi:DNA-binding MarR family transcriptional regulator
MRSRGCTPSVEKIIRSPFIRGDCCVDQDIVPARASIDAPFAIQYNLITEESTDEFLSVCSMSFARTSPRRQPTVELTMTKKLSDLENSPLHLFHRAVQVVTEIYQSEMAAHDLTARQYAVLFALAHTDGLSQSKLVDATGIDRSTMADIVRRMLKKGIIQRKRDKEDARAYEVKITDDGVRLFRTVSPIIQRIEDKLMAALKGRRVDEFLANLSMIVGNVAPVRMAVEVEK